MARIFVALHNIAHKTDDFDAMPPFYESFLAGLQKAGNQVLCYHHKTHLRQFHEEIPLQIKERLFSFDPQLCILFCNNFWDISHFVDCPIAIYDVDSPLLYANKDELRENIGRYHFIINQSKGFTLIMEELGAERDQIHYFPFFTEIQHDSKIIPDRNIVFLGTNWLWKGYDFLNGFPSSSPSDYDRKLAQQVLNQFEKTPFLTLQEIYNTIGMHPHEVIDLKDINRAAFEISGLKRVRYLSAVADLGLEIRGRYWQDSCMQYFPELLLSFNPKTTFTLEETAFFYNHAKIALNTNHIQAQNGFSFRVCDILASNACLVTEKSDDLLKLFPRVEIPTFSTPADAREQCIKLLNNENLRYEIVEAAHEAIEEKFRFRHLLDHLEDVFCLSLRTQYSGNLEVFSDEGPYANADNSVSEGILFKIRKHLGYDPNHFYPTKFIKVCGIDFFKIMSIRPEEKHVYCGIIPLISATDEKPDGVKIRFLPFHKAKKLIGYLKKYAPPFLRGHLPYDGIRKIFHRKKLLYKYCKNQKISVCLFASRISDWQFDELYRLLEDSGIFEPVVVVKPFVSQGYDAMVTFMETAYEALRGKGLRVVKTYDKKTDTFLNLRKELDPDILFYTMYWLPHFHVNYYIDRFLDRITFYTSYAYDCARHDACMNFPLNNCVDGYFMPTSIHKELAERCMDNHGKNVIVAGSPKLDIFFDTNYHPIDVWKPQVHPKKRIIWAPHHSDHFPKWQYQFNAFYELCDCMFKIANKYKDEAQFAFKPHPMLKTKLIHLWGNENTECYYQKWADLENGQLEEGSFQDLFLASDAMILDSISFIAEYMAIDKPSLFTVGPKSRVYLNEFGEMCYQHLYEATEDLEKGICNFIEDVVLKGKDVKAAERRKFIDQYLRAPKGKTSAQNIYDEICKEIFGKSFMQ